MNIGITINERQIYQQSVLPLLSFHQRLLADLCNEKSLSSSSSSLSLASPASSVTMGTSSFSSLPDFFFFAAGFFCWRLMYPLAGLQVSSGSSQFQVVMLRSKSDRDAAFCVTRLCSFFTRCWISWSRVARRASCSLSQSMAIAWRLSRTADAAKVPLPLQKSATNSPRLVNRWTSSKRSKVHKTKN